MARYSGVHPWVANFQAGYGIGSQIGEDWRDRRARKDVEALKEVYYGAVPEEGEEEAVPAAAAPPADGSALSDLQPQPAASPAAPARKAAPKFQPMTWEKYQRTMADYDRVGMERNMDPKAIEAAKAMTRSQIHQQALRSVGEAEYLMESGDLGGAATALTRLSQSLPDGRKRTFTATEDGIMETITSSRTGEQLAEPKLVTMEEVGKIRKAITGTRGLEIFGGWTQAAADDITKREQEAQDRLNKLKWFEADTLVRMNTQLGLTDSYRNKVAKSAGQYGWKDAAAYRKASGEWEKYVDNLYEEGVLDHIEDDQARLGMKTTMQTYGSLLLRANPTTPNAPLFSAADELTNFLNDPEQLAESITRSPSSPTGYAMTLRGRDYVVPAEFLQAGGVAPVPAKGARTAPSPMGATYTLPNGMTIFLPYMSNGEIKQLDKKLGGTAPVLPSAVQEPAAVPEKESEKPEKKAAPEGKKPQGWLARLYAAATGGEAGAWAETPYQPSIQEMEGTSTGEATGTLTGMPEEYFTDRPEPVSPNAGYQTPVGAVTRTPGGGAVADQRGARQGIDWINTENMPPRQPRGRIDTPPYQTPPASMGAGSRRGVPPQQRQAQGISDTPGPDWINPREMQRQAPPSPAEEQRALSSLRTWYNRMVDAGQMNANMAAQIWNRVQGMESPEAQVFMRELAKYFGSGPEVAVR